MVRRRRSSELELCDLDPLRRVEYATDPMGPLGMRSSPWPCCSGRKESVERAIFSAAQTLGLFAVGRVLIEEVIARESSVGVFLTLKEPPLWLK